MQEKLGKGDERQQTHERKCLFERSTHYTVYRLTSLRLSIRKREREREEQERERARERTRVREGERSADSVSPCMYANIELRVIANAK